ncbi:hypothetical protein DERP_010075 [Dermatophagoides pteronyssinus]|uniref:Uncharacterized protein n=1 Tax=Dermatophagoides pteronyssinus TaxID=6956 RepID=A0ABQ8JFH1_DERPT|nr:hypothetical protein DERP_010075 [Dermatophagoides pteronyssinus]
MVDRSIGNSFGSTGFQNGQAYSACFLVNNSLTNLQHSSIGLFNGTFLTVGCFTGGVEIGAGKSLLGFRTITPLSLRVVILIGENAVTPGKLLSPIGDRVGQSILSDSDPLRRL